MRCTSAWALCVLALTAAAGAAAVVEEPPGALGRVEAAAATRRVLATEATENGTEHGGGHGDDHDDDDHGGGSFHHFNQLFSLILFSVVLWLMGKASASIGMPSLVGEIFVGVALGPEGLDFVPFHEELAVVGEIGLILLVLEAGLHVDLEMLKIIGGRGLAVGVLGSIFPMGLAFVTATVWGADATRALAVSACMATMSTGIALNVLKSGGVLNQPVGQLIIAAATVNEICNIILITLVQNIVDDVAIEWYIIPVLIMFVLIGVIGALAVKVVPHVLDHYILPRVSQKRRANAVLGLIFVAALVLVPACKYSGSSELLGAFLAGFCFCTDHIVHETWNRQVKRIMHWLLRLFFAATIGFTIPVKELFHPVVLAKAAGLLLCGAGKLSMGVFSTPLDRFHFWILSFAWGEWGEFSFLIAATGRELLDDTSYNAIIVAVLISIVLSPYGLRVTLDEYQASAKRKVAEAILNTADVSGQLHSAYYCVQTRSTAAWAQQDAIFAAIKGMGCAVIDFRSFHPNDHVGLSHCVNELYVRDRRLQLPTASDLGDERLEAALLERVDALFQVVHAALNDEQSAEVRIQRWLPGSHLEVDKRTGQEVLIPNDDARLRACELSSAAASSFSEGAAIDLDDDDDESRSMVLATRDGDGRLNGKLVSGVSRFVIQSQKMMRRTFSDVHQTVGVQNDDDDNDDDDHNPVVGTTAPDVDSGDDDDDDAAAAAASNKRRSFVGALVRSASWRSTPTMHHAKKNIPRDEEGASSSPNTTLLTMVPESSAATGLDLDISRATSDGGIVVTRNALKDAATSPDSSSVSDNLVDTHHHHHESKLQTAEETNEEAKHHDDHESGYEDDDEDSTARDGDVGETQARRPSRRTSSRQRRTSASLVLDASYDRASQRVPRRNRGDGGSLRSSTVSSILHQAGLTVDKTTKRGLNAESRHHALRVTPAHELDGFVHTDAHRPFALPDDEDHAADSLLMHSDTDLLRHALKEIATLPPDDDDDTIDPRAALLSLALSFREDNNNNNNNNNNNININIGPSPTASPAGHSHRHLDDAPPPPPSPPPPPPGGHDYHHLEWSQSQGLLLATPRPSASATILRRILAPGGPLANEGSVSSSPVTILRRVLSLDPLVEAPAAAAPTTPMTTGPAPPPASPPPGAAIDTIFDERPATTEASTADGTTRTDDIILHVGAQDETTAQKNAIVESLDL